MVLLGITQREARRKDLGVRSGLFSVSENVRGRQSTSRATIGMWGGWKKYGMDC